MSKGQARQFFEVHVQLAFSAGTSTVESVSDNLNNEDLACVAGGLTVFLV